MLTSVFPVILALVGLLIFAFTANPKVEKVAYAMFAVGLFFTCWALTGKPVRLL